MFDKIVIIGETAWTSTAGAVFLDQDVGEVKVEDALDLEEGSGDFDESALVKWKCRELALEAATGSGSCNRLYG
ncbi:hypothetical protein SLEP1_g17524 [Rubroshorea leprosula]|uniref:Uncharacterized protein n=1 Tax=Rubroshorea leprosula TaxID=152421 RepID=A0AAV5J245_9ROSI|nr:hypothetical protein SLEP1_g17524 [Rubroshorea leprosula]